MSNIRQIIAIVDQVANAANEGRDGTWGQDADETRGYFVGGVVPSLILSDTTNVWGQFSSLAAMVQVAVDRGNNIGVWTDTETGKIYFDESEWVSELDLALKLARERGEIAIWDIANNEEIRVEEA